MREIKTAKVPCGDCNVCCRGDALFLHPELGDVLERYDTDTYQGRTILAHKENGDCIYLDRASGCTIYEDRPATCRELDCRTLLKIPAAKRRELIRKGALSRAMIKAAKQRKRR